MSNSLKPRVLLSLRISALGPPLSNRCCSSVARGGGRVRGSCDGYRLANRVIYVGVAAHFRRVSFDHEVWRYRPDFELWQRLIKERQENFIHANL
jgi:hypothetical protein